MAEILIVEDSQSIAELVTDHLIDAGHSVSGVANGQSALEHLKNNNPSLLVLDVMLPGLSGIDVCRWVRRQQRHQPIIVLLTARREEADALAGYDAGADDYVRKPFSIKELVRRVEALLALRGSSLGQVDALKQPLEVGALKMDPESRVVTVFGSLLQLAPMEFDLLLYLAREHGRTLDRQTLLREVWGYNYSGYARTVDSHITRLRRKLARVGLADVIRTVHGLGYRLVLAEVQ